MADVMKSRIIPIDATSTVLLSAPPVVGNTSLIHMLQIGNVDGAAAAEVQLYLDKNGAGAVMFGNAITVDAGKIVIVYSDANGKLTLENLGVTDQLTAIASAAGDLVAVLSYIERT